MFPEEEQTPVQLLQTHATGILPAHGIRNMIRDQQIWAVNGQKSGVLDDDTISLDLRLGDTAYRIEQVFARCLRSGDAKAGNAGISQN